MKSLKALFAVQLGSALVQPAHPPSTTTGEWPTYGGDLASSKSPLDQITPQDFSYCRWPGAARRRTAC
jgi:hypothetical protein